MSKKKLLFFPQRYENEEVGIAPINTIKCRMFYLVQCLIRTTSNNEFGKFHNLETNY